MSERRRIEEMKQQYSQIPVPEELKGRLEETIKQAAREIEREEKNMKRAKILKYTKRTAGVAAAAVFALVISVNSSASVAHAFEGVPVLGTLTKLVTFRNYEVQEGNMEADITTPKVEGLENKETEAELNKQLADYTDMLIQQFQKDLKEQGTEGYESISTTHQVLTDNEEVFSMELSAVTVQASGYQQNKYYTVEKATGKILSLKDLFAEGSDYQSVLTAEIQKQMREQMAADEGKSYFLDSEPDMAADDFKQLKADAEFYITNDGKLVIAFDEYEVAAGYMGAPAFEIPTEVVKDILPEQSLLK